ncbi:hypothetical protein JYT25_00020 [bacterium AH-315-C20]|nr:hypothetical protein [bacterium AH-315-C20]
MGTVLFHVAIFLCTNFSTIDSSYNIGEEITEVDMPLDEIEFDEEMMKLLELSDKQLPPQEIRNMAVDENDNRERSYEDFSTQELDEQVEMDAKALEKQYFEEWAATHPNEDPSKFADIQKEKEDKKNERDKNPSNNIDSDGGKAFAGQVMVSFNLKGRDAYNLPVPGYTCNGSGKVVIQIKVDKNGDIRETSFLPSRSPGATSCMVNKAKRYAKKSRFNFSSSVSGTQTGTITYQFKGQ